MGLAKSFAGGALAFLATAASPAFADEGLRGDYFVRPYAQLGGSVIDGYEANGATSRYEGFSNVVTSLVDLDEGLARTYVDVTGPGIYGSAAGVFGDTLRFYGVTGDPVQVSFAFDGTVFATPRTSSGSLFQIGVYATLYVFEQSAGAAYNNFTSTPGALVAQTRALDFSNPSSELDTSVYEVLSGSFTPVAGRSYEIFSSLSIYASLNANASNAVLDFRNTGRVGIDAPQGVTYASSSGVFLDSVPVIGAVPEPATWAMLIVGTALVGGSLRRRRASGPAFA